MTEAHRSSETMIAEPCYCRRCKGKSATPCPHKVWHFWRTVRCWLSGYHFDPAIDRLNRCKRCRTRVTI